MRTSLTPEATATDRLAVREPAGRYGGQRARVLAPEIPVIVIAPGMVHTGFVPGRTEEMMAAAAAATPLKRAIEADDVAKAVMARVTRLTHTTGSIVRATEWSRERRFCGRGPAT